MYTSGSYSGQSHNYLYNSIIAPFLTAAGSPWSFVETTAQTISSIAYTFSVWKSSGAANNSGMDWYLIFQYMTPAQAALSPANANNFNVFACEVYNTSGHTWNRPVMTNSNATAAGFSPTLFDSTNGYAWTAVTPNTVGTVYIAPLTGAAGSASGVGQFYFNFSGSAGGAYQYAMVANADGFMLSMAGPSALALYVGAIVSYIPSGDKPLVMLGFPNSPVGAGNCMGMSRDPAAGGSSNCCPYGYYGQMQSGAGLYVTLPPVRAISCLAGLGTTADLYAGVFASQILVTKSADNFASFGISGMCRGQSPDWLLIIPGGAGVFGDTCTVGGKTYNCVPNGSGPAANNINFIVDPTA
jgi:hypothetical protein